jgi:hypothetical protein
MHAHIGTAICMAANLNSIPLKQARKYSTQVD